MSGIATPRTGLLYVVAIDSGSQSTKVSIVDQHGTVHASAQKALRPSDTSVPGRVVHPDDDLWTSIARTCTDALAAFAGERGRIVGVGLCTIRFCRALLGADGLLAEPVMSWMDERVSEPHVDTPAVRFVTTSSGYITRRLTGVLRDTAANYQGVWPIDQRSRRWSSDPQRYRDTGMRPEQLAELVDPGERLGAVTAEAAEATGIPVGLPVFATANDKAVEALGSGLRADGEVLLSLGTYIAAMTTGADPVAHGDAYWVNFASEPGRYLYESGGIRRGMWTVSWYRSLLGGEAAGVTDQELNAGAEAVAPGSGGLMTVLDWLAPGDAPYRRGALLGFDGSQGRYHVYRSILEGIALTMRAHVAAMEAALGRRFERVIVSGGGSRSELMMQILADVFDRPALRTSAPDAAGLGAAICAMVGAGVHSDVQAATAAMVLVSARFEPGPETAAEYARIARRYDGLREYTDPLFTWLAD